MNTVASSVVGFAFQSSASIHVTARLVDQALNLKGQTSASVYRRNFAKKRFEPCQATGLPMVRGQLSPFQCLAQKFRVRNRTITDEAGEWALSKTWCRYKEGTGEEPFSRAYGDVFQGQIATRLAVCKDLLQHRLDALPFVPGSSNRVV